eukprot:274239-Pelagomonas_calceolata.AAC.1
MRLILGSLEQALAESISSFILVSQGGKKENKVLAHPQLLHPTQRSPTSPIFKMLSNLKCIQSSDSDMLKARQATSPTIRAWHLMLSRKSAMLTVQTRDHYAIYIFFSRAA